MLKSWNSNWYITEKSYLIITIINISTLLKQSCEAYTAIPVLEIRGIKFREVKLTHPRSESSVLLLGCKWQESKEELKRQEATEKVLKAALEDQGWARKWGEQTVPGHMWTCMQVGSVQGLAASFRRGQGILNEPPAHRKLGPNGFVKCSYSVNYRSLSPHCKSLKGPWAHTGLSINVG